MKKVYTTILPFLILLISSCEKQDQWLDVKRNKSDVSPETVTDFQAILDDNSAINTKFSTITLTGTDNIILRDEDLASINEQERNAYMWQKNIWTPGNGYDWNYGFSFIALSNVILEGLEKVNTTGPDYNNVKGQALFLRAFSYYFLAQAFCKPYDAATADSDPGLPLRRTSDANKVFPRSSLKELYDFIIADGSLAAELLSDKQSTYFRANKKAALGLLAKVYLLSGDYTNALRYANLAIETGSDLLDFNNPEDVSLDRVYRFADRGQKNSEIYYYASGVYASTYPSANGKTIVADELYNLYAANDLRKKYFFATEQDRIKFRGTYAGYYHNFSGIALNEIYLISAECEARVGSYENGLSTLNNLLEKRYLTGSFVPLSASDRQEALDLIIQERRKELPFTGTIRWEDLRRFNKDPRLAKTLQRIVNGISYSLAPNDLNYTLPIPVEEIQLTNIEQNERH